MKDLDLVIIGGGIVGLAVGYQFTRQYPEKQLAILEKEPELACHQTGHNSGVLHSGIYYKPGSLKAINCRAGKRALEDFCQDEGLPYEICGKVIVAVDESEVPALSRIYERGQANGVQCDMIDRARLAELEPHAQGVQAIHVPETGIVSYRQVCLRLAQRIRERGGVILTGARVTGLHERPKMIILKTAVGEVASRFVVNCAGLYSDRVIALTGRKPAAQIVPFRGEYYALQPSAHHLCKNLIYPVPDPGFPFLGVHFTRVLGGGVECGPNAVLAFAREGYHKTDINVADLAETLTYPGFIRLASRYWRTGLGEMWRSLCKSAFVRALQRLVPAIQSTDLEPAPAGVRAQAVGRDGTMVDDFLIQESERILHVGNAPSPAATASLTIGKTIVERLSSRFSSRRSHFIREPN